MDKRSDDIRQDIEQTRAALDEKIDQLQNRANEAVDQAKQTVDIGHQIGERPFVSLAVALATGFVVGKLGGKRKPTSSEYSFEQPELFTNDSMDRGSSSLMKMVVVAVVTSVINQVARQAVPMIREQVVRMRDRQVAGTPLSQREPSSAPNANMHYDAETINNDAIPQTNLYGMPPLTPSREEEEFYRTYEPGINERSVGEHR